MVKKDSIIETKELTVEEEILRNLEILNIVHETDEEEVDTLKGILCPFFKGHPDCLGCKQTIDKLHECKDLYEGRINTRPMKQWDKSFDAVTIREKVKPANAPTMICDTCYLADNCPSFQKMSTCAIEWGNDIADMSYKDQIKFLINMQQQRMVVARAAELQDGGIPDQATSTEMDRLSGLIGMLGDADANKFSMTITGQGKDGANAGSGILSKIFGSPSLPNPIESLPEHIPTFDAEFIDEKEASPMPEKVQNPKLVKENARKRSKKDL